MASEDGSVIVVYNGEIYNYPQLRDLVLDRGHKLTTHCDTEILPHLYEDEGIGFTARLNGIFAFALYDHARKAVMVAVLHLRTTAAIGLVIALVTRALAVLCDAVTGAAAAALVGCGRIRRLRETRGPD